MAQRRVLPGFNLALGYTVFYLTLLVLIPLSALVIKTTQLSWADFWRTITDPVVVASYRLTFGASLLATLINGFFGLIVAWVLVRYHFPSKRLIDAMIDFPFALPTAVAGLTFAHMYSESGWMGRWGLVLTNTNYGVVVVLIFVGLPFVVRTVQPILQEWEPEYEQAAAILGAGRWTTFRRVIFPEILPAWLSGLALAFARAVGEYGSVIFIAGNIPGKSQIAPLQIITKLDQFEYAQATAIGVVLLSVSLVILMFINTVEWWSRRHEKA